MKKNQIDPESIKPDLKHDTMEYAASKDGDDILDSDKENIEDDITAEELELLEVEGVEEQAAALNSVEIDRATDDDPIFDVNDNEGSDEEEQY